MKGLHRPLCLLHADGLARQPNSFLFHIGSSKFDSGGISTGSPAPVDLQITEHYTLYGYKRFGIGIQYHSVCAGVVLPLETFNCPQAQV